MELGNAWGRGEGWSNVVALIDMARKPDASDWDAERRDRILQQVLARVEKDRQRRQVLRAFAAGASTVLVIGLLAKLITGVVAPAAPSSGELAGKTPSHRLAAE